MRSRYTNRRFARRFNRFREAAGDPSALVERILAVLGIGGLTETNVVELGCGTGVMSREFCRRGARVKGFDSSEAMIRFAGSVPTDGPGPEPVYGVADHRKIPLPAGSADVVFGAWTVNIMLAETEPELRYKALEDLVTEVRRLARPGGYAAFLVPEAAAAQGTLTAMTSAHGFDLRILDDEWIFQSRRNARRILTFFKGRWAWKVYRTRWPQPDPQKGVLLWCRIGE